MKRIALLFVCLFVLTVSSVSAEPVNIKFHGCSPKYPNLCVTNMSEKPVHLFLTMKTLGCNGAAIPQPGAQYELIENQDYDSSGLYPSYYWKISHYNHFYIQPGETVGVQNAPCYEGRITYGRLGRAFIFSAEKWEHFKSKVLEQNPNCIWAR
jgi:hypothetical protein